MKATLTFDLPDEAVEHENALNGSTWKRVVEDIDQTMRNIVKHEPGGFDIDTAQRLRKELHEIINSLGLELE